MSQQDSLTNENSGTKSHENFGAKSFGALATVPSSSAQSESHGPPRGTVELPRPPPRRYVAGDPVSLTDLRPAKDRRTPSGTSMPGAAKQYRFGESITWGDYLDAQASTREPREQSPPRMLTTASELLTRSEKSKPPVTPRPPISGLQSRGRDPAKRRMWKSGDPITMRQFNARKSTPAVSDDSPSNPKRGSTPSTKRRRLSSRPTFTPPPWVAQEASARYTPWASNAALLGMDDDDDMLFDLEALARDRKPVEKPAEESSSPLPTIDVKMEESLQLPPNDQGEVEEAALDQQAGKSIDPPRDDQAANGPPLPPLTLDEQIGRSGPPDIEGTEGHQHERLGFVARLALLISRLGTR